jgi:hypothetical protein
MDVGRPSIFTQDLADRICLNISTSNKSLRTICKELGISVASVLNWLNDKEKPEFLAQYTRAKEEQADFLAEEMIEIADDGSNDSMIVYDNQGKPKEVEDKEWTNRSKLRVETRKWIASKLKPKKYGDKLQTENKNDNINRNITIEVVPSSAPLSNNEKDISLD